MKFTLLAAVAATSLLAGQAYAGSLSYTDVGYPTDYTVTLSYNGGSSETVYAGEFNLTGAVLDGTPIGSFNAWCVDITHDLQGSGTYITGLAPSVAGITDQTTIDEISELIAGYTPSGDQNSAATQVAIWEVEYGSALTVTDVNNDGVTEAAAIILTNLADEPLVDFGLTILDRGDSGNQDLAYVPEPASTAMFGVGLLGLCVIQRRRARA